MINKITKYSLQIEKYMNEALKDYNLTYHQWILMREIYFSEISYINAVDLSKKIFQDKRLTSLAIQKLEDQKYVIRVDNIDDKRNKDIVMSDVGLVVSEEILEIEKYVECLLKLDS